MSNLEIFRTDRHPVLLVAGTKVAIRATSPTDTSFGWSIRKNRVGAESKPANKFECANQIFKDKQEDKIINIFSFDENTSFWIQYTDNVAKTRRIKFNPRDIFGLKSLELMNLIIILKVSQCLILVWITEIIRFICLQTIKKFQIRKIESKFHLKNNNYDKIQVEYDVLRDINVDQYNTINEHVSEGFGNEFKNPLCKVLDITYEKRRSLRKKLTEKNRETFFIQKIFFRLTIFSLTWIKCHPLFFVVEKKQNHVKMKKHQKK